MKTSISVCICRMQSDQGCCVNNFLDTEASMLKLKGEETSVCLNAHADSSVCRLQLMLRGMCASLCFFPTIFTKKDSFCDFCLLFRIIIPLPKNRSTLQRTCSWA